MTPKGKRNCFWIGGGCLAIGFLTFLIIALAFTPIVDSVVNSQVRSQVVLSSDNESTWGEVPGEQNLHVSRVINMFRFNNPTDVFQNQAKPTFTLGQPLDYDEQQTVRDVAMKDNKNRIDFNQSISMTPVENNTTRLLEDKIEIPNLALLGVWDSVTSYNDSMMAYSGVAGLINALYKDNCFLNSAIATGIWGIFIKDKQTAYNSIFKNIQGLTEQKKEMLWSDPSNGLGSDQTILGWIKSIQNGIDSIDGRIVRNHFNLSGKQMFQINSILKEYYDAVYETFVSNYDCPNKICTSEWLTAIQWANGSILLNPPVTSIPATPSITYQNMTVFGYPEFNYFYSEYFTKNISADPKYNVTMEVETAFKLLNNS